MSYEKRIVEIFGFSRNTYYVWKREGRPIIELMEKYFSTQDLEEFIQTRKISRFDIKEINSFVLSQYFNFIDYFIANIDEIESVYFFFDFLQDIKQSNNELSTSDTKALFSLFIAKSQHKPSIKFIKDFLSLELTTLEFLLFLSKNNFSQILQNKNDKKEYTLHSLLFFAFQKQIKIKEIKAIFKTIREKHPSNIETAWIAGDLYNISSDGLNEASSIIESYNNN